MSLADVSRASIEGRGRVGPVANSVLIIVGQSTQALAFGAIALFLPLIRTDLDITFSQAGMLAGATTLVYALMQIPAGYLADRFNTKWVFGIGLLGVNVLSLLFSVLQTFELLLVNQALSGFFRALMFSSGLVLLTRQFRPSKRATAMGFYVAGGFSSNILLNLLGPVLIEPLGWRWLIAIFSVSGIIVWIAFASLSDTVPRRNGARPPRIGEMVKVLAHPVMMLAGGIQFVRLAVVNGMAFWLPTLLIEDKGFSLALTGLIVAIGAAVTAPANIGGGWLSDRLNNPLLVIGTALAVLAVTTAAMPFVFSVAWVITVVAVNAVFLQVYFGPLFAIPVAYIPGHNAGLLAGVGNFCANVGAFLCTVAMGALKDSTGSFTIPLLSLSALCVIGIVLVLLLRPVTRRAAQETHAATSEPHNEPAS